MAYVPTLADFDEAEKLIANENKKSGAQKGYTPTKADFDDAVRQISNENAQNKESLGMKFVDDINNFGGGVTYGIQKPITDLLQTIGNITGNQSLKKISPVKPLFFDPNTASGTAGKIAGELGMATPEMALAELGTASRLASPLLKAIPKVGGALERGLAGTKALDYAALGAATSPNHPILGGAFSGALGGSLNKVNDVLTAKQAAVRAEQNSPVLDEEAEAVMRKLHPNNSLSVKENAQKAADILRENHEKLKSEFNQRYQDLFEPFIDMGGNDIIETPNLARELANHDHDQYPLDNLLGKKTASELNRLVQVESPKDIEDLHQLQSKIGQKSSLLSRSSVGEDRSKGYELGKIRDAILDDIQMSLEKKGLGNDFSTIRKDYRTKIMPYRNNEPIANVVLSPKDQVDQVENLSKSFSNAQPGMEEIANQGGDPLKNSIIFDALKDSIYTNKKVAPKTLIRHYDALESNGLTHALTPESYRMLESFREKVAQKYPEEFMQSYRPLPDSHVKLLKDTAASAVSGALGSVIGAHFGHPFIGTYAGNQIGRAISKENAAERLLHLNLMSPMLNGLLKGSRKLPFMLENIM